MLISPAPAPQGDPVALAMVLVLAVVVAVMAFRKHRSKKNAPVCAAKPVAAQAPETPAPAAPGSAGRLKIHDVPPKTAACTVS